MIEAMVGPYLEHQPEVMDFFMNWIAAESTKTNAGTRKLPMTEDVYQMFQAIIEDRPTDLPEIMVQGYAGFLFRDKNGMPEVAMHWEHRFNHAVKRYRNRI